MVFGSQWTPLEIKIYLSICGKMGMLLGKIGPEKNIYKFSLFIIKLKIIVGFYKCSMSWKVIIKNNKKPHLYYFLPNRG